MAVPKQKQSHSRTTKRRSQHKAANPNTQGCPRCNATVLPHRVCTECGHYRGRTVLNTGI